MVKNKYLLTIPIFTLFSIFSYGQHYVGINGGLNKAAIFDFSNDENYESEYKLRDGYSFCLFYETKTDSLSNVKVEFQYGFQKADMKIQNNAGHFSYYKNISYEIQQLNLNLIYPFQLIEKKSFNFNILFGAKIAYTINATAKGEGWNYISKNQTDSLGNSISFLTIDSWTKDESDSKDISKFNFGINTGFDIIIPIRNVIDLFVNNRYEIFLTNITTMDKLKYTSLISGQINFGIRYKIYK